MLIGYGRVSTQDQNLNLQLDALKKYGVGEAQIWQEHVSAANAKRPELTSCLRSLREGDTLVVWRLDRLARSLSHLIKITQDLNGRKIGLVSLTEQIDTTTADFERELQRCADPRVTVGAIPLRMLID